MTAYLLTEQQHAQIVDALNHSIKWLNICDKPRECIPLHETLSMLKAMKPVELRKETIEACAKEVDDLIEYCLESVKKPHSDKDALIASAATLKEAARVIRRLK